MMKTIFRLPICALSLAMFAAGCKHQPAVNTISNASTNAQIRLVVDKRVTTDPDLAESLKLAEIRESQTNDGFKRIQVFLKNYSGEPYKFSYRFNWYDENGVEVQAADNDMWQQLRAIPGDDVTLTSMAPKRTCADFKLRIVSRH